jgi:nucleotide-binding universal stress UspA family protein
MQRQIVVPLDGSRLAEKALPHAVALARATGSGLTLLQVVSGPQITPPPARGDPVVSTVSVPREAMWESVHTYLRDVTLRLGNEGLVFQLAVLEGDAAETIIGYAEQHPEVAMIVMSTRGRSGLTRWVLGSVAEKVLQVAPVLLAVIRPPVDAENQADMAASAFGRRGLPGIPTYRTILVPLDGSVLAEEALPSALALAAPTGASLLLVSVLPLPHDIDLPHLPQPAPAGDPSDEAATRLLPPRQRVAKAFEELAEREREALTYYLASVARRVAEAGTPGIEVRTRVLDGDAATEILRASGEGGADLIVMSTRGHSGLARLWLGSVAMNVVRDAALPVLLVREQVAHQLEQHRQREEQGDQRSGGAGPASTP